MPAAISLELDSNFWSFENLFVLSLFIPRLSYFCWCPIGKEAAKRGGENDTRWKCLPA